MQFCLFFWQGTECVKPGKNPPLSMGDFFWLCSVVAVDNAFCVREGLNPVQVAASFLAISGAK